MKGPRGPLQPRMIRHRSLPPVEPDRGGPWGQKFPRPILLFRSSGRPVFSSAVTCHGSVARINGAAGASAGASVTQKKGPRGSFLPRFDAGPSTQSIELWMAPGANNAPGRVLDPAGLGCSRDDRGQRDERTTRGQSHRDYTTASSGLPEDTMRPQDRSLTLADVRCPSRVREAAPNDLTALGPKSPWAEPVVTGRALRELPGASSLRPKIPLSRETRT